MPRLLSETLARCRCRLRCRCCRRLARALPLVGGTFARVYIVLTLVDALCRSSTQVLSIFKAWDVDGSGEIDQREFRQAVKALGFAHVRDKEIDAVFTEFDIDESGASSPPPTTPPSSSSSLLLVVPRLSFSPPP